MERVRNDIAWFVEAANRPEMRGKKGELAAVMGVRSGAVSEILAGIRGLSYSEGIRAQAYFADLFAPSAIGDEVEIGTVPLRGYVGAGAAAVLFSSGDDPNERVLAPDGANSDTVAVEVRGESLGRVFDRWLVFYDEVPNPPTASMLGQLCVVGLADGRILVKQLKKGHLDGHYSLLSNVEPPIYDVLVEWAAVVKQMTPG